MFGSSSAGTADGIASVAKFNTPGDIAIDPKDYVYVADTGNQSIRIISPTGNVNTLSTTTITFSFSAINNSLTFDAPRNLLYVADSGSKLYSFKLKITLKATPFVGPYADIDGTYPVSSVSSSSTGIQTQDNNLLGASYADIIDLTT